MELEVYFQNCWRHRSIFRDTKYFHLHLHLRSNCASPALYRLIKYPDVVRSARENLVGVFFALLIPQRVGATTRPTVIGAITAISDCTAKQQSSTESLIPNVTPIEWGSLCSNLRLGYHIHRNRSSPPTAEPMKRALISRQTRTIFRLFPFQTQIPGEEFMIIHHRHHSQGEKVVKLSSTHLF